MLWAVEGIDGVGKTTFAEALAQFLHATYVKFPDRSTPTGRIIAQWLKGQRAGIDPLSFQCLQVCNRLERLGLLRLCAGNNEVHCICDRYVMSGLVYGMQDGLDYAHLQLLNEGFPVPDLTVLLTMSPELVDAKRLKGRDFDVYESRGTQGLADQESRFEQLCASDMSGTLIFKMKVDGFSVDELVAQALYFAKQGMPRGPWQHYPSGL